MVMYSYKLLQVINWANYTTSYFTTWLEVGISHKSLSHPCTMFWCSVMQPSTY